MAPCSPPGTVTALSSCGSVATGKQMGEPIRADDGWVSAVAFSPDGTRLVTGGADGAMRLWNVSTHQPADPPLPSHKGSVIDVDFSPDGRRIGSMSYLIGSDPTDAATSADGAAHPRMGCSCASPTLPRAGQSSTG